jgi:hypothetical protein
MEGTASRDDGLSLMPWSTRFDEPIKLPGGGKLVTLKHAGNYITKLSKAEQHHPAWQAAVEALILVAENNGPTMFARIGRHAGIESPPRSGVQYGPGKRKLARD